MDNLIARFKLALFSLKLTLPKQANGVIMFIVVNVRLKLYFNFRAI